MKKLAIILTIILSPLVVLAEGGGQCTADNVGKVQCMAQKECECKFFRKSEMAGTPDRFSWDCGIDRPGCGSQDVNVTNTPAYNGPSSVIIDKNSNPTTTGTSTTSH